MTVAALEPFVQYLEDGVTLAFPVDFRFLQETLIVGRTVLGLTVALVPDVDYSVTGGETDDGGTVTLFATLAGAYLTIARDTPIDQKTDYDTTDTFPAESHERALDKLTMIVQEQGYRVNDLSRRALKVPYPETVETLPPAPIRAQGLLGFDALGQPIILPAAELGSVAVVAQRREVIAAEGDTTFLTNAPYQLGYLGVYVNGVRLSEQEFTATDGVSVVLAEPVRAGDVVLLEGFLGSDVAGDAEGITYSEGGAGAITQSIKQAIKREPLNFYDRLPKELWASCEAHTNTVDLTAYMDSALDTERAIHIPPGRFRLATKVTDKLRGARIRGEGRHLTYLENVDNRPIIELNSSAAHVFGFELEDMWLENRNPATFNTCSLLVINGAGNGETFQNDGHYFHRLWLFQGYDNIAVYNRCIWPIWDDVYSTGALRDAMHVEVSANVNQWTLRNMVLKGAGRFGLFFRHTLTPTGPDAYNSPATNWTLENLSTEDCDRGGWRFMGSGGFSGFGARQCTFENNAHGVAAGSSAVVDGVRQRKANVFTDCAYAMGFDINGCSLYCANPPSTDHPDAHIYVDCTAPGGQWLGSIANSRFLAVQPGGNDVVWTSGLTFHANNLSSGAPVAIDRAFGSLDMREMTTLVQFTPTIMFGGSSAGVTYGNQRARYTIHGRMVFFTIYVSLSNKGAAVGPATIGGLPLPAFNSPVLIGAFEVSPDGMQASVVGDVCARISPGAQVLELYRFNAGSVAAITNADFGNFSAMAVSGSYMI